MTLIECSWCDEPVPFEPAEATAVRCDACSVVVELAPDAERLELPVAA